MGFFSKIWKGIKKTVKKIGKGIKGAFAKFGKFMGKIGILGQVAMMFLMPYVGAALGGLWTGIAGQTAAQATASAAGAAATAASTGTAVVAAAEGVAAAAATTAGIAAGTTAVTASATGLMGLGSIGQAAGKVMQFVGNTVGKAGNVFSNITKGVTDTLSNFAKTASNKMFGTSFDAAANFFGPGGADSAFGRSFGETSRFQRLTTSGSVFKAEGIDRKAALDKIKLDKKVVDAINKGKLTPSISTGVDTTVASTSQGSLLGEKTIISPLGTPIDPKGFSASTTGVVTDATEKGFFGFVDEAVDKGVSSLGTGVKPIAIDAAQTVNISPLGTIVEPETFSASTTGVATDVAEKSLWELAKKGVGNIGTDLKAKVGGAFEHPVDFALEGFGDQVQGAIQTKGLQALDLVSKPSVADNYNFKAYVPNIDSFVGSQQRFGASEIMPPNAFAQQVTNSASPYGYTAFQYGQYMAQNTA